MKRQPLSVFVEIDDCLFMIALYGAPLYGVRFDPLYGNYPSSFRIVYLSLGLAAIEKSKACKKEVSFLISSPQFTIHESRLTVKIYTPFT